MKLGANGAHGRVADGRVFAIDAEDGHPKIVYRTAGDTGLLVEYGQMVLDMRLRFRIDALEKQLRKEALPGLIESSPGIRSVLITYDPMRLPLTKLVDHLKRIESNLAERREDELESRVVHLPLAFYDRWTRDAVRRYMDSIRSEGPYLPDNVEFAARCNGLAGPEEILKNLTGSTHIVMGLGDVYLGAPCAVTLDPTKRMVVPKYNPARTFTPSGAVGLGGSYICIYPMDSPGGYQLIGRTLPIWDTFQKLPNFREAPWLLRIFDRIQFEPVSEAELERLWKEFREGEYRLQIEQDRFDVPKYERFCESIRAETEAFREQQARAAEMATEGY